MSKNPAFQFYPGDWLSSQRVTLLTLEEEGAYIRLLCYCWQHGSIPADPKELARLIGKGATVEVAKRVSMMFQLQESKGGSKGGSILVHDRLESLKQERAAWIEKSRQGGIKSGQKRRMLKENGNTTKHPSKGGSEMVEDCFEPKGNTSSSSSSSFDTLSIERPSEQEVLGYASMIGLPEWRAKDWWLDMEAKGWRYKGDEVVNWQAFLARVKTWWEGDGRKMAPGTQSKQSTPSGEQEMPDWRKIQVLAESIEKHPGNSESTYFKPGCQKSKDEFLSLKRKLKELRQKEAQKAMS